jgi:hypothetical protein
MTSGETEAFATRLSAVEAEHIHEALDQTGLSRSDIVARGLRYYLEESGRHPGLPTGRIRDGSGRKTRRTPPGERCKLD